MRLDRRTDSSEVKISGCMTVVGETRVYGGGADANDCCDEVDDRCDDARSSWARAKFQELGNKSQVAS